MTGCFCFVVRYEAGGGLGFLKLETSCDVGWVDFPDDVGTVGEAVLDGGDGEDSKWYRT